MMTLYDELKKAGLETCNLIVGIDGTGSNRHQGRNTFGGQCLHALNSSQGPNPYELAMKIMCRALSPFDDDQKVSAYIFGDAETQARSVRPLSKVYKELMMDQSSPRGLIKA